jgi:hypothetical protein
MQALLCRQHWLAGCEAGIVTNITLSCPQGSWHSGRDSSIKRQTVRERAARMQRAWLLRFWCLTVSGLRLDLSEYLAGSTCIWGTVAQRVLPSALIVDGEPPFTEKAQELAIRDQSLVGDTYVIVLRHGTTRKTWVRALDAGADGHTGSASASNWSRMCRAFADSGPDVLSRPRLRHARCAKSKNSAPPNCSEPRRTEAYTW